MKKKREKLQRGQIVEITYSGDVGVIEEVISDYYYWMLALSDHKGYYKVFIDDINKVELKRIGDAPGTPLGGKFEIVDPTRGDIVILTDEQIDAFKAINRVITE